jgi:hypothetical protein
MQKFEVDPTSLIPANLWNGLVKFRAGYACERCKNEGSNLHAHHKDRDHSNNRLDNGQCLCARCHGQEHGMEHARRFWEEDYDDDLDVAVGVDGHWDEPYIRRTHPTHWEDFAGAGDYLRVTRNGSLQPRNS